MKRILLPTDFSKISLNAIDYATQIYKDEPCRFYLLNVYRIPYLANEELMEQNVSQLSAMEDEMHEASIEDMKKVIAQIPENKNHVFEIVSDYNLFNLAVHQAVEEKDIELIIMGTKGATGAREIFLGSNTSDVIMRNACNVMAIPENHIFKPPKEILFPSDFRISYDLTDLMPLINLAKKFDSKIRIVHFSESDELDEIQRKNKDELSDFLEEIPHEYYTLSSSNFEEGLNCFTQSRGNIDMILILGRHYGFFERLFFKPKVKLLSFHSRIPLFVVHHQDT